MALNNFKQADFYPRRVSQYVPAMTYHSDVGTNGLYICSLGAVADTVADGLIDGLDIGADTQYATIAGLAVGATVGGTADGGVIGTEGVTSDAAFGRNIVLSGVTNPCDFYIEGFDYLGQPMAEQIAAAATTAAGVKAFYRVTEIHATDGGDTDCDIGWGNVLGLPFTTKAIVSTFLVNVLEGTAATLVRGLRTTTQTATTADPRGTFDPNGTPAGTEIVVVAIADNFVDTNGAGGLHGMPHYWAAL